MGFPKRWPGRLTSQASDGSDDDSVAPAVAPAASGDYHQESCLATVLAGHRVPDLQVALYRVVFSFLVFLCRGRADVLCYTCTG
jgi:hypothetical protein